MQKIHIKFLKNPGKTLLEIPGITPVKILGEIPGRTFEKIIVGSISRIIPEETQRETSRQHLRYILGETPVEILGKIP